MHAKVQDDTKLQLKQPNLGWISPTIFVVIQLAQNHSYGGKFKSWSRFDDLR